MSPDKPYILETNPTRFKIKNKTIALIFSTEYSKHRHTNTDDRNERLVVYCTESSLELDLK